MLFPKSVLITGANRGIGLEFVKQFSKLSSPPKHVFAVCRNADKAEDLKCIAKENPSVCIVQMDIKDDNSIAKAKLLVEKTVGKEGLTLLINNAGQANQMHLDDVTRDEMRADFEINAIAPLMVAKAFLPLLIQAAKNNCQYPLSCNRAAIINISTILSSLALTDGSVKAFMIYPYKASKAALNMITKILSLDLIPDGILCSALHPGWVQTDMGTSAAPVSVEESVKSMLETLEKIEGKEASGNLYDCTRATGTIMPW